MAGEDDSQNRKELPFPTTVGDADNLVKDCFDIFSN